VAVEELALEKIPPPVESAANVEIALLVLNTGQ